MSKRIETEKKYYCLNNDELIEKLKLLNFKLIKYGKESDEYFTDINSEYIKNRTCLRIRKSDNKMEVTFKGKSKDFSNTFSKLESNLEVNKENYEDFVNLFSMIGYYSYCIVNKTRSTYQMLDNEYTYNVMIDNIENLGGFVEFELIYNNDNYDEDDLYSKLNKFVNLFSSLELEEANLPYRDFVAKKIYNDYLPKKDIYGVHINLDKFLKKYEKNFYSFYKLIMKQEFNCNSKIMAFRENIYDDIINPNIKRKFNKYFDNIKIQDGDLILLFELLKQIKKKKLKILLSTNCNEIFINNMLNKFLSINIIDNIIYLNNNKSYYSEIKKHDIDLKNYFNVSKLPLKETNSILLIIINNL